ncbi:MAG: YitT family protein [Clostridiales bacterium]|nr:YitT family protein [Clostridiales bacterium]
MLSSLTAQFKKHEPLRAYAQILIGCIIGGAAYPLFLVPNNIAPGGLTGIATILNYLFGMPVGVTSMALNLPLFLIGFKAMGRVFVIRSFIATVLFSAAIDLLKFPPLTDDVLLGTVYGALLLGVGLGLIMRGGATTGGSDMIARMVNKRVPFITVGTFLFIVDCLVILAAAFTMSSDAALYALICIFVSAKAVDLVLAGMGSAKACFVVTNHQDAISRRIMDELERGVTLLSGVGAYTGEKRGVLISVVSRAEVLPVKRIVREEDQKAFVFITDTHETLGEGFSNLQGE